MTIRRLSIVAAIVVTLASGCAEMPEERAVSSPAPIPSMSMSLGSTPVARVVSHGIRIERGYHPSISGDGRFVAFESDASGITPGDTNATADVFLRDVDAGTTQRVSVSSQGTQANGYSMFPSVSADGGMVAFQSSSSNLVPGDTNRASDVFVRSLRDGVTTRVSLDENGRQLPGGAYFGMVSSDGSAVAYHADGRIFLNLLTRKRVVVVASKDAHGTLARYLSVDAGGRRVLFGRHVRGVGVRLFVFDAVSGETTAVPDGGRNPVDLWGYALLSSRGNLVVFVGGFIEGAQQVYVADLRDGTTAKVAGTCTRSGAVLPVCFSYMAISGDERVVAFSTQDALSGADRNDDWDVYARDLATGRTTLVSADTNAAAAGLASTYPVLSTDGRYVAFVSAAKTLVAGSNGYGSARACVEEERDAAFPCRVFRRDVATSTTVGVSYGR